MSEKYRGHGYGKELLNYAINQFDLQNEIYVQTFDESVTEGKAARRLYVSFGFKDYKSGGLNPAGVNTVIMKLLKLHNINV